MKIVELRLKTERLRADRPTDLARAATLLRQGETVAFPTETVYGLGANALDGEPVEKIFVAKQRPHWDPLIVHVSDFAMLARVATWSKVEETLMRRFWPGPLTLLLPRLPAIPDAVTAGRPLVGVRMPQHPVALELIRQAGVPIAAPSANRFGHTSPTTARHVLDDLDGRIAAVLDGGETAVGLESTVAQVVLSDVGIPPDIHRAPSIIVYRPGAVDLDRLHEASGIYGVELFTRLETEERTDRAIAPESLASPGLGIRHYAPRAKLLLVEELREEEVLRSGRSLERSLVDTIDRAFDGTEIIGAMLPEGWNASCARHIYRWGPWHNDDRLAQRLYAGLRALDEAGATVIVCPVPNRYGIGEAIRDRLRKAARTE